MGISPFHSSSSIKKVSGNMLSNRSSNSINTEVKSLPNPKPDNYKILRYLEKNKHLIVEIQYLDCTNYEGKKILVFENCNINQLKEQKLIDPHFSDDKTFYSPIARFEPTIKGWELAYQCVISMTERTASFEASDEDKAWCDQREAMFNGWAAKQIQTHRNIFIADQGHYGHMSCGNCGKPIEKGDKMCAFCDAQFTKEDKINY